MGFLINLSIVILVLAIYGHLYKIPVLCYGCETPEGVTAMFFKCINDTTKDSEMCRISKVVDDLGSQISNSGKKITGAIIKEVSNLPLNIQIAYDNIITEIKRIIDIILQNINSFREELSTYINNAYQEIKTETINSLSEFQEAIVRPVLEFIQDKIASPVMVAIKLLLEFKDLLQSSIETSYNQLTGDVINLQKNLVGVVSSIPKVIEEFINLLIKVINDVTGKSVEGMNKGISSVVGITNTSIGTLASTVDNATDGIVNVSKEGIQKVEDAVNNSINLINENTVDKINLLIDPGVQVFANKLNEMLVAPINKSTQGISDTVNKVKNPIVSANNEVTGAINKVIDFSIPRVAIPNVQVGEIDLGLAKIPAWTLLNETTILNETKILSGVNKIATLSIADVSIPSIKDIKIDTPDKLDRIDQVEINVDYSIPKVGKRDGNYVSVSDNVIDKPKNIDNISLDPATKTVKDGLTSRVRTFTDQIQRTYNDTMRPINDMITNLLALYQSIKVTIGVLFSKYLTAEFAIEVYEYIKTNGGILIQKSMEILKERVLVPFMEVFDTVKEHFLMGLTKVIEIIKESFTQIKKVLGIMFNKIASIIYDVSMFLLKTGWYFTFFSFSKSIDTAIPIDIPVSIKITWVFLTACLMGLLIAKNYAIFYFGDFVIFLPYIAILIAMSTAGVFLLK